MGLGLIPDFFNDEGFALLPGILEGFAVTTFLETFFTSFDVWGWDFTLFTTSPLLLTILIIWWSDFLWTLDILIVLLPIEFFFEVEDLIFDGLTDDSLFLEGLEISGFEDGFAVLNGHSTVADGSSTDDDGFSIDDDGFSTDDEGCSTDEEGYSTDDEGCSTDDDGCSTEFEGFSTDDEGFSTDDDGCSTEFEGFSTDDEGFSTDDDGFSTDDDGCFTDEEGCSTEDEECSTDDEGCSTDDDGFSTDDEGCSTDGEGCSTEDEGCSTDDEGFSTDDEGFSTNDGFTGVGFRDILFPNPVATTRSSSKSRWANLFFGFSSTNESPPPSTK